VPRPRIRRRITLPPRGLVYKPAGVPLESLPRVVLLPDELEALRLIDLQDLSQEEAAAAMGVSRSTLQRILNRGRRQVTRALVDGAALVLEPSPDAHQPAR
jgi:uncharacterized protein